MSYRLSAETSRILRGQFFRFLLIEGQLPVRFDLELVLRKRFPDALVERLFVCPEDGLRSGRTSDWVNYDLVLVSNQAAQSVDLSALRLERQKGQSVPLIVVLTSRDSPEYPVLWEDADVHLMLDASGVAFAARLDAILEVARVLRAFPLALPDWRLLEVLHNSENAVVFLAENRQGELSVIKRFKFDLRGVEGILSDAFVQDAYVLEQMRHPGLVRIFDVGVAGQALYLVMEYVSGYTLKFLLAEMEMSDPRILDWFRLVAEALGVVHAQGLLHRDLKASNIMIREEEDTPVLLDFGIESKLLMDSGFLHEDEIYCTPFYVSPERIVGEAASVQSDLYALGVLLFEMLTGDKPYPGSSLGEVLQKQVFEPVPRLPGQCACFQPLIDALLAKAPERRPDSVAMVLEMLDHCLLAGADSVS